MAEDSVRCSHSVGLFRTGSTDHKMISAPRKHLLSNAKEIKLSEEYITLLGLLLAAGM